ncbi:MAG: AraC family transcriptional regulator, partial [Clostridia bacterium]|nr:AraC family transcriptional regulator [Clostridia bacterium]
TVTEYIIQKRLIRVSELVLEGASLENAALSAGFNSYSHFYKMFIKYKGISPKQYFDFFRNT